MKDTYVEGASRVTAFFVFQVFAMFVFWRWLFGRRAGLVLAAYLIVTWIAAIAGVFLFGPLPPPLFVALLPATIATIWLARTLPIEHIGIELLIGYQAFRILVEIFLWWGHLDGMVPVQLTWEGRNFDLLTGVTAPIVAWLYWRNNVSRLMVHIWNLAGLALLINVVSVAALSMPTPFQYFRPANFFVAEAPFVWLPLFLVQSALFGHVALMRRLR
jgi:hypothetical protein